MKNVEIIIDLAIKILKLPITVYGYTISFWEVLIWSSIASIVAYFLFRIFR